MLFFSGEDYRAVLLRTLEGVVTEVMLTTECLMLSHDNDKITGSSMAAIRHEHFLEKPENHDIFFQELRIFLDKHLGNKQDLSFIASTKQKLKGFVYKYLPE